MKGTVVQYLCGGRARGGAKVVGNVNPQGHAEEPAAYSED